MRDYSKKATIINTLGIHARPASLLTKEAMKHDCDIFIKKDDMELDAKSIMNILMLGAEKDTELLISASGSGSKEAVENLVKIINDKFYEE